MNRPRLLDLFCGAGGASVGYHRAGFDVVGVDIRPQPRYPFEFHQTDALEFLSHAIDCDMDEDCSCHLLGFDAIHASPPCQHYAAGCRNTNKALGRTYQHPALIEPIRARLESIGLPFVIENVVGSPLRDPIRLCGTSFGLPLRRHRLFEVSPLMLADPPRCHHGRFTEKRYWTGWTQGGHTVVNGNKRRATTVQVYGNAGEKHEWPAAMGIDWMQYDELAEAIPPAYTEWIGKRLLERLG